MVGMANPASTFCIQQGGTLEIRKDAEGNQIGFCKLPDGTVVEEWEFFRSKMEAEDQNDQVSIQLIDPASETSVQQAGTLDVCKEAKEAKEA